MVDNTEIKIFLVSGFTISIVFICFVYLSLYLNPWLWFEDYPEDIREMIVNLPDYTTQKVIIGLLGIMIIVGMILQFTLKWMKNHSPDIKFINVFIYVFLMFQAINLWDLLIIDWLIFTWITPEFVVIPGTEEAEGYNNYLFHFKASYLSWEAWLSGIILSTFIATFAIFRFKFVSIKKQN